MKGFASLRAAWTAAAPCRAMGLAAIWFAWAAAGSPAFADTPGATPNAASAAAPAPACAASAPSLVIRSLRVVSGAATAARQGEDPTRTLTSAGGDLEIGVSRESHLKSREYRACGKSGRELRLYLNGVDVSRAATAYAERGTDANEVALRYRITSAPEAQAFWSALYREHGLARESALAVELGWPETGPNSRFDSQGISLDSAVTADGRKLMAAGALLALGILMLFLVARTDTFRDSAPAWLATARQFKPDYDSSADAAARDAILARIDPTYVAPGTHQRARAALAAAGETVGTADHAAVAAGLLLRGGPLPEPTFSLSRLQLGMWFAFAVLTGLFLWIVYGDLPAIAGSVLALLGISVGTAGASISADPGTGATASNASRGLLLDVVTGFNQAQQVHRYQAVVVNLLLLGVGLQYVFSNLSFPTFDSTWLAILGISGGAYAVGKKLTEQAPTKPG